MKLSYGAKSEDMTIGPCSSWEEVDKAVAKFPNQFWYRFTQFTFDTTIFLETPVVTQEEAERLINDLVNRRKGIVRPAVSQE